MQVQQTKKTILEPEIRNIRWVIKPLSQSFNFISGSLNINSGPSSEIPSDLKDELNAWDQLSDDAFIDLEVAL